MDLLEEMTGEWAWPGRHITDVHLAVLAIEHQAELFSYDTDLARFPGPHWTDPLR